MRINNNIMALNTHRQLSINNTNTQKALEKLSSGYRINRAGDDAAGLAISEKMRAQIRGLKMASKNAQDGISLIQTAEGALTEVHDILQRMRELAVQAASDTNTDDDRKEIQKEINQLIDEIDRIASDTEFNTRKLLDGSFSGSSSLVIHIGANTSQTLNIQISNMSSGAIGSVSGSTSATTYTVSTNADPSNGGTGNISVTVTGNLTSNISWTVTWDDTNSKYVVNKGGTTEDLTLTDNKATVDGIEIDFSQINSPQDGDQWTIEITVNAPGATVSGGTIDSLRVDFSATTPTGGVLSQTLANASISIIDDAIKQVSAERAKLGAYQNRLEHTIRNLDTSAENLQAAESRIRDVDMAQEMMEFTKQNILMQAATAMLAQANMAPQTVLKLLG